MQVKQIVASVAIAGTMGMGGLALAGTASASTGDGQPGTPGHVTVTGVTKGNDVGTVNGNKVSLFGGNKLSALNGNKVLSGNTVKLEIKVVAFNGNFSNNILNSGANSFNSSVAKYKNVDNSFNTVVVTKNETTTITTNNSGAPGQPGHGGPGH